MEALRSEYRVMACDLPGHGARAGEPFRMEAAVVELAEEIDRYSDGPVLLVGISLGGHIATLFANRYPKKIAGLVLSGASMNFRGVMGIWTRLIGKVMLRMNEDRLKRSAESSIRKKWPVEAAEDHISAGLFPYGTAQAFLELPRYDFRRLLAAVEAPVLILNGELDRPNRKGEKEFAAAAPDVRVQVIAGAGHACNIEQSKAYTRSLREFATKIVWMEDTKSVDIEGLNSTI